VVEHSGRQKSCGQKSFCCEMKRQLVCSKKFQ
jgi:hypothetical protein